MSLPPALLRVKRKRTEDPVESLYIETSAASKRARSETSYVFRRLLQDGDTKAATDPRPETQPDTISIIPSNAIPSTAQHLKDGQCSPQVGGICTPLHSVTRPVSDSSPGLSETPRPRRFLLARPNAPAASAGSQISQTNLRRGKHDIALLIEDRRSTQAVPSATNARTFSENPVELGRPALKSRSPSTPLQAVSAQKRPSAKYGIPRPPLPRKALQSTSQDKMFALEKWAGEELASMTMGDSTAPHSMIVPSVSTETGQKSIAVDHDVMEIDEEGDFVYDTYMRYEADGSIQEAPRLAPSCIMDTLPTSSSVGVDPEPEKVGYLVITDADVDLWDAYASDLDEADEKDDWDSEQDDENAENYYGADYPEEEVSSDDEYGQDPYRYCRRSSGFSDDEDYDLADNSGSEELEPWERKSIVKTGVYRRGEGELPYGDNLDDQSS